MTYNFYQRIRLPQFSLCFQRSSKTLDAADLEKTAWWKEL